MPTEGYSEATATIRCKHSGKIQSSAKTILQYWLSGEICLIARLRLASAGIVSGFVITRIRESVFAYSLAMASVRSVLALSTIVYSQLVYVCDNTLSIHSER